MDQTAIPPPIWMEELHKKLQQGRSIVLHGNVNDRFLHQGGYVSLNVYLENYLKAQRYDLVGRYDIVDGLTLAEEEAMASIYDRIINEGMARPAPPSQTSVQQPNVAVEGRTGERQSPLAAMRQRTGGSSAVGQGGSRAGRELDANQALDAFRILLRQNKVPTALILDYSDRLLTDPSRMGEDERKRMVLLEKVLKEVAIITTPGPLQGAKNALIIVASRLSALPESLYFDSPFTHLLRIEKPSHAERQAYVLASLTKFTDGESIAPDAKLSIAQTFADLTDGMSTSDLDSIRRASFHEQLSITNPRELIHRFKYGRRENPWKRLTEDTAKVISARDFLSQRVIGQDAAVAAVAEVFVTAQFPVGIVRQHPKSGRPKGVFFFVGPTGVGKTELAKALSEFIFSDDTAMSRFDMSEYTSEASVQKLIGSPPGYVGYGEGGQLTNRVMGQPFQVLLFDEIDKIEKDGRRVLDLFLQILEDGRLTDSMGRTADFSQTVIIFTGNHGCNTELIRKQIDDETPNYELIKKHFEAAVEENLCVTNGRPELYNRLKNSVIAFDVLRPRLVKQIGAKFLSELVRQLHEQYGLELCFEGESVWEWLRIAMNASNNLAGGGRNVRSVLEKTLVPQVRHWMRDGSPGPGQYCAVVNAETGAISISPLK